jgi:hypothetical protein
MLFFENNVFNKENHSQLILKNKIIRLNYFGCSSPKRDIIPTLEEDI